MSTLCGRMMSNGVAVTNKLHSSLYAMFDEPYKHSLATCFMIAPPTATHSFAPTCSNSTSFRGDTNTLSVSLLLTLRIP